MAQQHLTKRRTNRPRRPLQVAVETAHEAAPLDVEQWARDYMMLVTETYLDLRAKRAAA